MISVYLETVPFTDEKGTRVGREAEAGLPPQL